MSEEYLQIENLVKKFGDVAAVDGLNLSVEKGKLLSFLGPSGCGKTTTLRMIAGLETPTGGRISVNGTVLSDEKHTVLPEKRNMSMVFQSYAVWPHMTVFDNVAYGLKIKKYLKVEIENKVKEALHLVGLDEYSKRFPTQLSGGQQQRVALARALVSEPDILLLDEPLCNLDAKLRENMRFEIRSLQQRLGITTVYVTHSQDEALAVSDEIVIMKDGKLLQRGAAEEIYARPNCSFVAGFIGLINKFKVEILSEEKEYYIAEMENGKKIRATKTGDKRNKGEKCYLLIRPENIVFQVWNEKHHYNSVEATVENVSFTGNIVDYFVRVKGIDTTLRIQSTPPVEFSQGMTTACYFRPDDCILTAE